MRADGVEMVVFTLWPLRSGWCGCRSATRLWYQWDCWIYKQPCFINIKPLLSRCRYSSLLFTSSTPSMPHSLFLVFISFTCYLNLFFRHLPLRYTLYIFFKYFILFISSYIPLSSKVIKSSKPVYWLNINCTLHDRAFFFQ